MPTISVIEMANTGHLLEREKKKAGHRNLITKDFCEPSLRLKRRVIDPPHPGNPRAKTPGHFFQQSARNFSIVYIVFVTAVV